ncbi:MAG: hypothetical protein K0Q73_8313 [Paenibacillus sp.]|nr:hypothetical protein [Paenibacillus sp.]
MDVQFQLDCRLSSPLAQEAARIATERIGEIKRRTKTVTPLLLAFAEIDTEGYVLEISTANEVQIGAKLTRNFIAGLGELLHRLLAAIDQASEGVEGDRTEVVLRAGKWDYQPSIRERIHYMPGHFGNSFEVCSKPEMFRYLEDLALSGASGYGDWFDPNDMPDPYHSHVFHSSSMFLWRRKKEWLSYSQRLGLDNVLVVCPNIGYVDQMRPEWVGVRNHSLRVQGQVLCPSNPDARKVILDNHHRLMEDVSQSGIELLKIVCAPYDDGGCACPDCQPYYPVFLKLVQDVYATASRWYPNIKASICGWWTSEEESQQLRELVSGPARQWFDSFLYSASYGVFELPRDLRTRVGEMELGSFVHIGFSHDRTDVYTKTGIHSASRRIQSVFRSFAAQGCNQFMTYNESFGDHFNAFAAGLLGWNPNRDIREIAEFYCRLLFRIYGEPLRKLVDVLLDMEMLDESRAVNWRDTLREIEAEVKTHEWQEWAFAQIRLKAELMHLDHVIAEKLEERTELAMPYMEERLNLTERLWRRYYGFGVWRRYYGFGVLRHILIPDRMLPSWYQVYRENQSISGKIKSGFMDEDA